MASGISFAASQALRPSNPPLACI